MTQSTARENLGKVIGRVVADRAPIIIRKNRDVAVLMLPLEDYESLRETAYLLGSPRNALR